MQFVFEVVYFVFCICVCVYLASEAVYFVFDVVYLVSQGSAENESSVDPGHNSSGLTTG